MKPFLSFLALCFCLLNANQAHAQASDREMLVQIDPLASGNALHLHDTLTVSGAPLQIETLRFYLSQVTLHRAGKVVFQEKYSYHLIDLEKPETWSLPLRIPTKLAYDSLSFLMGIDSATHYQGAMEGDLDPTKGMYWSWQSGYIQVKIEGNSPLVPDPRHEFQLHLGGFEGKNAVCRSVGFAVKAKSKLSIGLDLGLFFQGMDLGQQHHIMSPGPGASDLSTLFSSCFFYEK